MAKKLAVIIPAGLDPEVPEIKASIENIFVRNAEKLKEADTTLDYFLLKRGFTNIDAFTWESLNLWNSFELFETVRGLSGKGYDGVVLHCYLDPFLYSLRQMMDIPVVGVVQSSLIFANLMGGKTGIVTFARKAIPMLEELLVKYNCRERVVAIESTESRSADFYASFVNAHELIESFKREARKCIAAGAEVLVPG
jgi:Asp/Glu/hydantoin racemase